MFLFSCCSIYSFLEIFKAKKFGMGFLGGLVFGPGFFWGGVLLEVAEDIFGFRFLPPFNHSHHLKSGALSPC